MDRDIQGTFCGVATYQSVQTGEQYIRMQSMVRCPCGCGMGLTLGPTMILADEPLRKAVRENVAFFLVLEPLQDQAKAAEKLPS